MALAKNRKIYGKQGGRFVVSEGIAPAEALRPHRNLPTLATDVEDDRFQIVIYRGTVLSVVNDASGNAKLVPANGTATAKVWDDVGDLSGNQVTVGAFSTPVAVAQYDLWREFDKGTSQLAGFLTHGYVEYPIIDGLNDTLAPGDFVRADNLGRLVKMGLPNAVDDTTAGDPWHVAVGKVVAMEKFATNYDRGYLQYMQLPSDPGALKTLFELQKANNAHTGYFGARANLDVASVLGAFRVNLTL